MKVFYTFGTDPRFPFCGGWVEIEVESMKQACQGVKKHLLFGRRNWSESLG